MQIKNEGLNKKTEPDYIRLPYLQLLSKERLEKIASWRETQRRRSPFAGVPHHS